ncbi:hypothetical protein [uncultured Sphingomonas sp.]|uniref:hypothetical protein n=1 Tax=uncultured Sphingomonas sp. TaxID=158754 RepID=UPI0025CD56E9|nr:hypothetical protein [uncultured Sphingomonas sp.]
MINWNDPESWPCPIPGFQSVPQIFEALGRKMSPDGEWTGLERQVIRPDPLPKPADVFQPQDEQYHKIRYSPGASYPSSIDNPGLKPEDRIADFIAYNHYSARAALLAGVSDTIDRNITFAEWSVAYDRSEMEQLRWQRAAVLREKVFVWMHRRAAAGNLVFRVFDWSTGAATVLERDVWQCTFDVARARFLRGAISPIYPNSPAPKDQASLQIFNSTFTADIYAEDTNVIEMLRDSIYEKHPTSPDALIELRAQALLQAAKPPTQPDVSEINDSQPSTTAPPPLPKKRGPKPRYDWRSAEAALMEMDGTEDIFARIISGEVPQAVAENYMASWFNARGKEPAESSVRASVTAMIQHRRDSNAAKASNKADNSN